MRRFSKTRRRRAAIYLGCLLTVVRLGLSADHLSAQVIRGTVVDAATDASLPAVFVVLVDAEGRDRLRYLADANGTFSFSAPSPGRYSLRIERLGVETYIHEDIEIGADQTVTLRVPMQVRPVVLDGLEVEGDQRCELSRDAGVETQRLWEEARKALVLANYTDSVAPYRYELVKYQRDLDPQSLAVRQEVRSRREVTAQQPITSRPPQVLADSGYVIVNSGENRFLAPDAAALLSDAFLQAHCIGLRAGFGEREGLLGLEFRPVRRRAGLADIEGVLWLDGQHLLLKWLEFRYTNLPGGLADVRSSHLGGRVEFTRLPEGTWIVSRWWIRMPVAVEYQEAFVQQRRVRLVSIAEEGGRVVSARRRSSGEVAFSEATGSIDGTVTYSRSAKRGTGVDAVLVVGFGRMEPVDSLGHFEVSGLPEGRYQLAYLRPELMGLDASHVVSEVEVARGQKVQVQIESPPRPWVLAAACGVSEWEDGTGVLLGSIVNAQTAEPTKDVEVVATWQRVREIDLSAGTVDGSVRTITAVVGPQGSFMFCAVPTDQTITVSARSELGHSVSREVALTSAEPVARVSINWRTR